MGTLDDQILYVRSKQFDLRDVLGHARPSFVHFMIEAGVLTPNGVYGCSPCRAFYGLYLDGILVFADNRCIGLRLTHPQAPLRAGNQNSGINAPVWPQPIGSQWYLVHETWIPRSLQDHAYRAATKLLREAADTLSLRAWVVREETRRKRDTDRGKLLDAWAPYI